MYMRNYPTLHLDSN